MTMNLSKEIGGYFGLDIVEKFNNIGDSVALNSARNCLRYIISAFKIKKIYIPYYTCPVIWESIEKEGCKINFYHIDEAFMPVEKFEEDAYILYTNYFGICAKNVKKLAKKYENLIVDNAQAFYMPQYGIASFNSIRKFFGVSDGALLYSNKDLSDKFERDTSYQRFSHLLKRIDINAQFGYEDFCKNDNSFINEPIKLMSNLTKTIFNSIDINKVKEKRLENYKFLNNKLSKTNELKIVLDNDDVPMVYPYLVKKDGLREKLTQNKIYIAQYWSPVPNEYYENVFYNYLLPLPIDQRYGIEDMKKVNNIIGELL